MEININWLGGFFDGEGSITIVTDKRKYKHPRIILAQSGEAGLKILQHIQKEYGGKLYEHLRPGKHGATKSAYKLYWNKLEGITFLKKILPHLHLKQQKAKEILDFWGVSYDH